MSIRFFSLPAKGQVKVINGQTIGEFLTGRTWMAVAAGPVWAFFQALGECFWAALIILTMSPLVILTTASIRGDTGSGVRAGSLILPRRAAYRMVAAYLVPVVLAGAFLRAMGHSVSEVLGLNGGLMFWFLATMALAVWTGFMARRMYGGKRV